MRNNKGITLVALVITIIVLLILAGVSIAALGGQNGILTNASKARQEDAIGAQRDVVAMAINEATNAYYSVTYAGADEEDYPFANDALKPASPAKNTKVVGGDAQETAINFIKDATKVSNDEATTKGEGAKVQVVDASGTKKVQIITTDDAPIFIEATLDAKGALGTWSSSDEYTAPGEP